MSDAGAEADGTAGLEFRPSPGLRSFLNLTVSALLTGDTPVAPGIGLPIPRLYGVKP